MSFANWAQSYGFVMPYSKKKSSQKVYKFISPHFIGAHCFAIWHKIHTFAHKIEVKNEK